MSKAFYLKKFGRLCSKVHVLWNKSIEMQVPGSILEQIEALYENCTALVNETKTLPNELKRWPLFEESYEDLNVDYNFVLKMLAAL